MIVQRSSTRRDGGFLLAGLTACLVVGVGVALDRATVVVVALVGLVLVGTLIVCDRRRMAQILWAAVAFTAPLQGVRVSLLLAVSDVLLLAAIVAILPDVLHRHWRRVVPAGVVVAFGLLVFSGLVGTFFAAHALASLLNLVKIVLAAAGSVVAMALWDPGATRLRRFAWTWFAGATFSALWAAATPRSFVGRSPGLTTHPNHFGLVCVLAVGLGLGLALSSTGRLRVGTFACVALLTVGVGLSGSRSAVLGLAVTVVVTAVLTRRLRLLLASAGVLVVGTMAVVVGIVHVPGSNALSRLAGGGGSELSDAQRGQLAADAFASISKHPFTGEGFELAQAAHSIYLQALVVGGILALLSFVCLSCLILLAGLRTTRARRGRPEGSVLAGLVAGYAGYLVSGAFDNILWDRYLWTYIGLLIVLAASPAELVSPEAPLPPLPEHQRA